MNEPIQVAKRMVLVRVTDDSPHNIATEAALLETDLETIGAVHYKP